MKKGHKMKKTRYIDNEEHTLIESYERGEFKRMPKKKEDALKKKLQTAARNHRLKNARINIRLSEADLDLIKHYAAKEGLPYQTLVSSVLHKFATGQLS